MRFLKKLPYHPNPLVQELSSRAKQLWCPKDLLLCDHVKGEPFYESHHWVASMYQLYELIFPLKQSRVILRLYNLELSELFNNLISVFEMADQVIQYPIYLQKAFIFQVRLHYCHNCGYLPCEKQYCSKGMSVSRIDSNDEGG